MSKAITAAFLLLHGGWLFLFSSLLLWKIPLINADAKFVFHECSNRERDQDPNFLLKRSDINARLTVLGIRLFGTDEKFDQILTQISQPFTYSLLGVSMRYSVLKGADVTKNKFCNEFVSRQRSPYDLFRINSISRGVLIDIGANVGLFSVYAALQHPSWDVFAFEPSPTSYFIMCYNMFLNGLLQDFDPLSHHPVHNATNPRRVHPMWGAFGPSNATHITLIEEATDAELTTIAASNDNGKFLDTDGGKKTLVPVHEIHNFLKHRRIESVGFLKIDCEGCEFQFLPQMGDMFTDRQMIKFVGIEFHLSLMDPKEVTVALKPNEEHKKRTLELMRSRGCDSRYWESAC